MVGGGGVEVGGGGRRCRRWMSDGRTSGFTTYRSTEYYCSKKCMLDYARKTTNQLVTSKSTQPTMNRRNNGRERKSNISRSPRCRLLFPTCQLPACQLRVAVSSARLFGAGKPWERYEGKQNTCPGDHMNHRRQRRCRLQRGCHLRQVFTIASKDGAELRKLRQPSRQLCIRQF